MINYTIKNIPDKLQKEIKRKAQLHHRSINREMLAQLEQVNGVQKMDSEEMIRRARGIRSLVKGRLSLNDDVLRKIKNEGRP